MNFEPSEERRMLQDMLRRYLADRQPADPLADDGPGFRPEVWTGLAGLGVIGALFPQDSGGFGGAGFDIATVFEELGRAGATEPMLDTAILGGGLLASLGDAAQRALLAEVIGGGLHLALAHGEPASRYDLTHVATRAVEAGGQITLSGRKSAVVNAEAADWLIVSAREGGDDDDAEGISLMLMPRDCPGLTLRGAPAAAGGRVAEITLADVQLPATARLGPAGRAWPALERVFARANVALAAETLGAIETALDLTRDYLATRQQFGRPIGSFQAVQHRMADLLIEREMARSAVIGAAGHLDDAEGPRYIAAARNLLARAGRQVAEETIQLHGGIAMTRDYALGRFARRIVMAEHRLGDADHHLERFIELDRG